MFIEQYGFCTKKWTCTNVLVCITNLFDIIGEKRQVDTIYANLSTTFDSIDHNCY